MWWQCYQCLWLSYGSVLSLECGSFQSWSDENLSPAEDLFALIHCSVRCQGGAVTKLFLRLVLGLRQPWKEGPAAELVCFPVLMEPGWPDCARWGWILYPWIGNTQKKKIQGEQEPNQYIFSVKAWFWHECLYYVAQHCCSKVQIGFLFSVPRRKSADSRNTAKAL